MNFSKEVFSETYAFCAGTGAFFVLLGSATHVTLGASSSVVQFSEICTPVNTLSKTLLIFVQKYNFQTQKCQVSALIIVFVFDS